jgi:hypothetical protein
MSNPGVSALAMHEPAATGICAVKRVTKAAVEACSARLSSRLALSIGISAQGNP